MFLLIIKALAAFPKIYEAVKEMLKFANNKFIEFEKSKQSEKIDEATDEFIESGDQRELENTVRR